MAFEIASQAEIPNISGGSPTALELYTVSNLFGASHNSILSTFGRSDAQGIL